MITRPRKRPPCHGGLGRLVCAAIFSAALTLVAGPFLQPAVARADFNHEFYTFCIKNLGQGNDYCCAHAGGTVKGASCVDPATGNVVPAAAVVKLS